MQDVTPGQDYFPGRADDQARAGFLNDIAALIDGKYGGSVARNFVYEVITART